VKTVKRGMLPVDELKLGDMFQTGQDRHAHVVTVTAIDGDDVTLDANHPLAGVDLVFDTEIVEVREATAEEVAHGHAHGPGGHHHH
jgi:FKBP-type peptidyl-prolyl cis-trans isomerase SlyD